MDGEKTRGADARKVRRLLKPARLDRRLSLTPPISLDSISSADAHKAISVNTHFERGSEHLISSWAYLRARWVDRFPDRFKKVTK